MSAITIYGAGFRGPGFTAPSAVHVGPTNGPTNVTGLVVVSDSEMTCVLPPKDPSWPAEVGVWITTPHGVVSRVGLLKYVPPVPLAFTSITPASGDYHGGTTVVLKGKSFQGGGLHPVLKAQLLYYGEIIDLLDVVINSDTQITAVTPGGIRDRSYGARVSSASEVAYLGNPVVQDAWRFVEPDFGPGAFAPSHGSWSGGQLVTVTRGPGQPLFTLVDHAKLIQNGVVVALTFTIVNGNEITFTMPNANTIGMSPRVLNTEVGVMGGVQAAFYSAAGALLVEAIFTYEPLRIFYADPDTADAAGGIACTIYGTALDTLTAVVVVDHLHVHANIAVTALTLVDENSASFLLPAADGIVAAEIRGTGVAEDGFGAVEQVSTSLIYVSGFEPTVVSSSPPTGDHTLTTEIVIIGTNFIAGAHQVTQVRLIFDGSGPNVASFVVDSDTQITAQVAPDVHVGRAYAIRVYAPYGTATSAADDLFTTT